VFVKERANLQIDAALYRELKAACEDRDMIVTRVVERLMREQIDRWKAPPKEGKKK
jgi:hypothetical protein